MTSPWTRLPPSAVVRGEDVERLQRHRPVGVGVVVDIDLADVGLPLAPVELVDVVLDAVVQVDRLGMDEHLRREQVRLADDPRPIRRGVDDHDVLRGRGPQADLRRREVLRAPVPPPVARLADVALLADEREEVVHRPRPEDLARLEGPLERRATQVREQDVEVVRIDPGLLGRALEEELRVVDDVLVDGRARRDEHADADALAPSGATELLPCARDRARIAREHGDVERADVDARAPARSSRRRPRISPSRRPRSIARRSVGQVAAAVATDSRSRPEVLPQRLAKPRQDDLDRDPRPPEDDRLAARADERQRPTLGMRQRRAARARGGVEQRRVDEEHVSRARGRPVPVDEPRCPPGQLCRQLRRVPDRRRGADDDRVRAVVGTQPEQPPQDVRDVAPEHAPIGMQLVDDDHPDLLEELEPLGVMGEDRRVEHVRVRHHDLPGRPDRRPDRRRRVAVVRRRSDRERAGLGQPGELRDLVLAEGLRGKEEQGARRRVLRQRLQDRQRVAEGLARRGRRHDDDVLAGVDGLDGLRLVAVERRDSAAPRGPGRSARPAMAGTAPSSASRAGMRA